MSNACAKCEEMRKPGPQSRSMAAAHLHEDQSQREDNGSTRYTYYQCPISGARWMQTYDYEDHGRYWDEITGEDSFARIMTSLKSGAGYVHLDTQPPQCATTPDLAAKFAELRQAAIDRGERVAYLFTHEHNAKFSPLPPRFVLATGVTMDQAKQLLSAGAEWIGAAHHKPPV
jgi:hypothetical protein